ncbi:nucleoredoxin-like protein 2 [Sitophilus oryzae]|uniref:Nucleoredoxin-like protein 2 n=1 Tax=Sitophilus oryzae TaxID=7048 RepID=A0A6J2X7X8_SITOR|nr:nucleoredoxin-like protein 2 [Sitophilus oryzae]
MDMLQGKKVISKDGSFHPVKNVLRNKKIVVYFFSSSAVNRPDLMQKLRTVYQENLKRATGIEVIYVSSDIDEAKFKYDYTIRQGPWLAIPFKDPLADELRYFYGVSSLPMLVVVKKEGDIITKNGRQELESLGIDVIVTWTEYIQQ